jgi:transcriptional regulator with XRE-family HTH domain
MNAALLRKMVAEKGWDTTTFADRCLVAPRYMQQVLKGLTPSKRLIIMMARELGCDPNKIAPDVPELRPAIRRKQAAV